MLLVAALTSVLLTSANQPSPCLHGPIGVVESVTGSWLLLPGNRKAEIGSCLMPGDSLRKEGSPDSGDITIYFRSGPPLVRSCRKEPCSGAFRVAPSTPLSASQAVVALFTRYWSSQPKRPPIFAAARGAGSETQPAVVALEEGRLKLGSAIADMSAGGYRFRFRRQLPSSAPEVIASVVVPETSAIAVVIEPGLYALDSVDEYGAPLSGAVALLVLAAPNPAIDSVFEEVRAEVRSWPKADSTLIRGFLTEAVMALYMGGRQ